MTERCSAVIFDLDGTLLDSLDEIARAMNSALAELGLPSHPAQAYLTMIGEGVDVLAQKAAPGFADQSKLVDVYRHHYRTQGFGYARPFPGVPQMLQTLVTGGVRMAVLSNKRDDFTTALVAHHFGQIPFVDVRGERVSVPRKPNPEAALELHALLGAPLEQTWFVGDTPIDMYTARNAGMRAVGVDWGFRSREELLAAGASVVVASAEALLEALGGHVR